MCINTTENIRTLSIDDWHLMVDDGTNNTTRRNSVLHLNDERYTHFEFQFLLNDTTNDVVVMYICVVITFLGIIGNIVTMAKIICDSKYHTPTFAAIGYLALADFFSLSFVGIYHFTNILYFRKLSTFFMVVDNCLYFSCSGHMLLLSIVRYLITVHPLHSRQHLTVQAVSFCSMSVWVFSALFGVVSSYIYITLNVDFEIVLSVNIIVEVLVSAITIVLHTHKKLYVC